MLPAKSRRWVYRRLILNRIKNHAFSDDTEQHFVEVLSQLDLEEQKEEKVMPEKWRFLTLEFFKECGDVSTRLDWIKCTLPDSTDKFPVWKDYELRQFHELFRRNYMQKIHFNPGYYEKGFFGALMESGMYFFMTFHNEEQFNIFFSQYPNSQQVRFINTSRWIELALAKGKKHFPRDPEMRSVSRGVDFDVESFFCEQHFLDEIRKLYDYFDMSGYSRSAISEYYQQYMSLHGVYSAIVSR